MRSRVEGIQVSHSIDQSVCLSVCITHLHWLGVLAEGVDVCVCVWICVCEGCPVVPDGRMGTCAGLPPSPFKHLTTTHISDIHRHIHTHTHTHIHTHTHARSLLCVMVCGMDGWMDGEALSPLLSLASYNLWQN